MKFTEYIDEETTLLYTDISKSNIDKLVDDYIKFITRKRVQEGIRNTQSKGNHFGARKKLDYDRIRNLNSKGLSGRAIAREVGCSNTQVMNILAIPAE